MSYVRSALQCSLVLNNSVFAHNQSIMRNSPAAVLVFRVRDVNKAKAGPQGQGHSVMFKAKAWTPKAKAIPWQAGLNQLAQRQPCLIYITTILVSLAFLLCCIRFSTKTYT